MKKIFTTIIIGVLAFAGMQAQNRVANSYPANLTVVSADVLAKMSSFVCDTLHNFNFTDPLVIYTSNGAGGYVTGQNGYGDLSKAEKFTGVAGQTVQNLIIQFAVATYGDPADVFQIKIWDNASGLPGAELASMDVNYTTIETDVMAGNASLLSFPSAVTVNGSFFLGYHFGYGAGDTIAAYTNTDGNTNPGTAYEEFSDSTWHPFSDSLASWGLHVSLIELAEVCTTAGIKEVLTSNGIIVSPNPGNGVIKIAIANRIGNDASIEVYNAIGKIVFKTSKVSPFNTIALDQVESGMYMVKVKSDGKEYAKRVLINR